MEHDQSPNHEPGAQPKVSHGRISCKGGLVRSPTTKTNADYLHRTPHPPPTKNKKRHFDHSFPHNAGNSQGAKWRNPRGPLYKRAAPAPRFRGFAVFRLASRLVLLLQELGQGLLAVFEEEGGPSCERAAEEHPGTRDSVPRKVRCPRNGHGSKEVKSRNSVPVNIRFNPTTKIGSEMGAAFTYRKKVLVVLTHSHVPLGSQQLQKWPSDLVEATRLIKFSRGNPLPLAVC